MDPTAPNLGGVNPAGGGQSSAADSSTRTDYENAHNAVAGAGNRGYSVNIAFPNSAINADAGINQPALDPSNVTKYALYVGAGIFLLAILKKMKG